MERRNLVCAPIRDRDWALFLDVDGTLLEIAQWPEAVHVSERLRLALAHAEARESGALALISGRKIADLDRLFEPSTFAAAGVHGAERRSARGDLTLPAVASEALDRVRVPLMEQMAAKSGIVVEDKGYALAIHYRQALHLEKKVTATVHALAAELRPDFHVQPGKCVLEIKPAGCSKGEAIRAFMGEAPFCGRRPVFVGDDETDESGFEAVNALAGLSVRVGYGGPTTARWRFADVNEVIRWLRAPQQAHGKPVQAVERVARDHCT